RREPEPQLGHPPPHPRRERVAVGSGPGAVAGGIGIARHSGADLRDHLVRAGAAEVHELLWAVAEPVVVGARAVDPDRGPPAIHRGVSQKPQSGLSQSFSGATCSSSRRMRSATSTGVSARNAFTSTTPAPSSLSVGNSFQSRRSSGPRLAYSSTICETARSRSEG